MIKIVEVSVSLQSALKKLIGQELFVDIKGKSFAPKGILKEVSKDFIMVGDTTIPISSIDYFRPARRRVGYK